MLLPQIWRDGYRYQKGGVGFASQGTGSPEWMMRQEHLSPCYTTRWEDLPVAR
ncbi:DUF4113 domain-containing protein [Aeromonas allosaccharophila]|uniref:DUF4113 domain-containing protein n=1 Tax=Aeromonas allosaccharophila TaxID=656 RepID=UPI003AAFFE8B